MASKIKGLQMWCKKMTEGYPNVDIANFTTSWRNGLAFCAIIHRFRPDLIDFDSLSPDDVFDNCKLAFELAEKELQIPAFLEASDMARLKVPDKLSIITYVSQYYNYLHALPQLGGPGVKAKVSSKNISGTKRPPEVDVSLAPTTKKASTDLAKENSTPMAEKNPKEPLVNKCAICQKQVYLLERHMEGGKLYHRSCFRHSELSPTNKVYSRSPFLSPSLNSGSPVSPFHEINDSKGDGLHNDKTVKKTEGVAVKHSLSEPDREDSKKSKYQSSESSSAKIAIKERLEDLKSKYTEKEKIHDHYLPLSSKEANKLEKRKAEILSSEKSAETAIKGSKRSVPLIFQKQEELKASASLEQSVSLSSTSSFPKTPISNNGSKAGDTNKFLKDKTKFEDGNDLKLDQKITAASVSTTSQEATKKLTNPKAKPRSLASTFINEMPPAKLLSDTSEMSVSKEKTPKPAPRRLFTESSDIKPTPERPKALAISQDPVNSKTKNETPESPPPLPSTLPPSVSKHPSLQSPVSPTTFPPAHAIEAHSKISSSAKTVNTESKESERESNRVSEKRWSTPAALASPAVLVIPMEKKEEENVKTGLLSSLAKVRNRTMSTPGPNSVNLTLPSQSHTVSNQSNSKFSSVGSSKPDYVLSDLSIPNKSKLGTQSKEKTKSTLKPSGQNELTIFKVPDETPKKDSSTAAIKSKNIPESVSALSSLKHIDLRTPSQTQSPTKSTTKEKSETPSLMGILKNGIKKSTKMEIKDVASKKDSSVSPALKDVKQLSSVSIDVSLTERKPVDQIDRKKSNTHLISTDSKSNTENQKNVPKSNKFLPEEKVINTPSSVDISVKLQRSNSDTMDSDVLNTIKDNSLKPVSLSIAEDVPQWKKNMEERKKKREELAKIELSTVRTKSTSSTSDSKMRPKSADILDLMKRNELFKVPPTDLSRSPLHKSVENLDKNKENDFGQVLEAKAKLSKPKSMLSEPVIPGSKLDWQLEAEKKMAAIATLETKQGFDSHISKVSSIVTFRVKDSEESVKVTGGFSKTDIKKTDFVLGKNKLKSIESVGNIQTGKTEVAFPVNSRKPEDLTQREDFREKLRHLKHVDADKSETDIDMANVKETKKDTATKLISEITLPTNNNNNNLTNKTKLTDQAHIVRLNEKPQPLTVSNLSEIQSNTLKDDDRQNPASGEVQLDISINNKLIINHERKPKSKSNESDSATPKLESHLHGKTSPKVKRKITVLGRNKQGTLDSPPASPVLKKIEVPSKFDFNESLKSSLTESTSQMSIEDTRTPPPRPPPIIGKKSPGHISVIELQQQLMDIDSRLTDLEIRGRDLEDSIRKVSTSDDNDDDELMIEWFSLITEKNDLVRKEADLVYISREQELENEQEKIEYQLRYLLNIDEHLKSPEEKKEEEYLIQRKVELVEQRNVIVDSIDEDRLRYEEEDRQIKTVLEGKGLLKDQTGMTRAMKGKKVARSIFYT
ncbi:MICAL-like protein 1 [Biomphalaria glabrata]|uniref:MICAL-like protein 1 isoform X1 n=1 Tax=Biomphalaria glabrata TaxID=6526 RepID=A0A9W2ZNK5_BIOGL|nr:MICAL-like protein 1 isoform X1 [Biomphalaria glabrata]XP_055876540.1 MICAL-like protein 1 isoform X1 [Biomphalaria glabrata]XP_055876541.1 MICAL-like protein 1 isoform X1 [Biomphalaria glabrata]XP_055876542.1 MICAL-like protein 1 isoform X1 [Biomphalaria glabrata]KAI8765404.1 MICAL-like protein 1 [Biomphalaria glabrata]